MNLRWKGEVIKEAVDLEKVKKIVFDYVENSEDLDILQCMYKITHSSYCINKMLNHPEFSFKNNITLLEEKADSFKTEKHYRKIFADKLCSYYKESVRLMDEEIEKSREEEKKEWWWPFKDKHKINQQLYYKQKRMEISKHYCEIYDILNEEKTDN